MLKPDPERRTAALRAALTEIDNLYFNRDEYDLSFADTAAAMDNIAQEALEADDNFTPALAPERSAGASVP